MSKYNFSDYTIRTKPIRSYDIVFYIVKRSFSCPSSEKSHDTRTQQHAYECISQLCIRTLHHIFIEEEFVGQQLNTSFQLANWFMAVGHNTSHLDETGIQQNPGTDCVQNATNDGCSRAAWIVSRLDT